MSALTGYCATTTVPNDEAAWHDKGAWRAKEAGVFDLHGCANLCRRCDNCRWVSYSPSQGDCSSDPGVACAAGPAQPCWMRTSYTFHFTGASYVSLILRSMHSIGSRRSRCGHFGCEAVEFAPPQQCSYCSSSAPSGSHHSWHRTTMPVRRHNNIWTTGIFFSRRCRVSITFDCAKKTKP